MASLTHILYWNQNAPGGARYEKIDALQAQNIFKEGHHYADGTFVCALCHQMAEFYQEKNNAAHFRHQKIKGDAADKECEDRVKQSKSYSQKYQNEPNCQPVPLYLERPTLTSVLFKLGITLLSAAKDKLEQDSKFDIYFDDSNKPITFNLSRLAVDKESLINVGQFPCYLYKLSFDYRFDNQFLHLPKFVEGITPYGSLFIKQGKGNSTYKLLSQNSSISFADAKEFILVCKEDVEDAVEGLTVERIHLSNSSSSWNYYTVTLRKYCMRSVNFFLRYGITLKEAKVDFFPIWPPYIQSDKSIIHQRDYLYYFIGDKGIPNIQIYPPTEDSYCRKANDGDDCSIYKLLLSDYAQVVFLDNDELRFSYLLQKDVKKKNQSELVKITDTQGSVIEDISSLANRLSEIKKIFIEPLYDGYVEIYESLKVLRKFALKAGKASVLELKSDQVIKIYQGNDLIKTIDLESEETKQKRLGNLPGSKEDKFEQKADRNLKRKNKEEQKDKELYNFVIRTKGDDKLLHYSFNAVLHELSLYPLTSSWVKAKIKDGAMPRVAYNRIIKEIQKKV